MAALPGRQVLADVISGRKKVEFEFLAIKIFLGMASIQYQHDSGSLDGSVQRMFEIFEKNQNLPSAQKDIQKLI